MTDDEMYCCKMREKFVIGILTQREDIPVPTEAADFMNFDERLAGKPILQIRYCPFCGERIAGPLRPMTWTKDGAP